MIDSEYEVNPTRSDSALLLKGNKFECLKLESVGKEQAVVNLFNAVYSLFHLFHLFHFLGHKMNIKTESNYYVGLVYI